MHGTKRLIVLLLLTLTITGIDSLSTLGSGSLTRHLKHNIFQIGESILARFVCVFSSMYTRGKNYEIEVAKNRKLKKKT